MIKQRFLLGLILMMAITPVWSALGYYSTMVSSLSAEASFEQAIAVTDSADAAPQHSDHCLHQDKFKIACHASGSCTFHICGDGGIAAVFSFTQAYSSYRYEHWEKSVSRSLSFSPEIRPPINNL
ncbi:hypothetical protein ABXJ76_11080 [Methylobacter sp. G7]|uniref:hypothetical protein n=1 Tax=Methylobacter sp. G7 TaxID=3230117 RepID=UPI003D800320